MSSNADVEDLKPQAIELFKKWHRTGFISVGYWNYADRVIIEIGSVNPDDNNSLKGATKSFIPVFQFLAYLQAEVNGNPGLMFPKFEDKGVSFFGGNNKPPIVSRIFNSKIYTDYRNNNAPDPFSRTFTCAHYEGEARDKGVIIPNYKAEISKNTIKLALADLAEMYQLLSMQVLAETVTDTLAELKSPHAL